MRKWNVSFLVCIALVLNCITTNSVYSTCENTHLVIGDYLYYYARSKTMKVSPDEPHPAAHFYRLNLNTHEETRLLNDATEADIHSINDIIVSPDKNVLCFLCSYHGKEIKNRLMLYDIPSGRLKTLLDNQRYNSCASFSPNCRYIAFYSSDPDVWFWQWDSIGKAKGCAVMVVDIVTGKSLELAPENYWLFRWERPSWSPDSKHIVFSAAFGDDPAAGKLAVHIYKVDLEGENLIRLTPPEPYCKYISPVWMSNGKIYYSSRGPRLKPKTGIYVMDTNGGNNRLFRATFSKPQAIYPSPDLKYLLFEDVRKEDRMGYRVIVDLEGKEVTTQTLSQIYGTTWRY